MLNGIMQVEKLNGMRMFLHAAKAGRAKTKPRIEKSPETGEFFPETGEFFPDTGEEPIYGTAQRR